MTTLLTRLEAKDDASTRELAAILTDLQRATPAEPGCLRYEVSADAGDPRVHYIHERWASAEDADRHARHVAAVGGTAKAAGLLAAPLHTSVLLALEPGPRPADALGA